MVFRIEAPEAATELARGVVEALGTDFHAPFGLATDQMTLQRIPEDALPAMHHGFDVSEVNHLVAASYYLIRESFHPSLQIIASGKAARRWLFSSGEGIIYAHELALELNELPYPHPQGMVFSGPLEEVPSLLDALRGRVLTALELCLAYEGVDLDAVAEAGFYAQRAQPDAADSVIVAEYFSELGFFLRCLERGLTILLQELTR